jgi:hypothetical protein
MSTWLQIGGAPTEVTNAFSGEDMKPKEETKRPTVFSLIERHSSASRRYGIVRCCDERAPSEVGPVAGSWRGSEPEVVVLLIAVLA